MSLPPKTFKDDSNSWAMRDDDGDGAHNAFMHNDPVFGFLDNCINGNGNANINGNGNGNVNPIKSIASYGGRASHAMPPLHTTPYNGGYTPCYSYSATYTAANLPTSLSHFRSAQQQSLLDMNVSHLSQQISINQEKNQNPNLSTPSNYSHLPIDTFVQPALSSSHYPPPQMSALVRGNSNDESGDHTDNSCSNDSNNGENIIDIPNQSYFYDLKEVQN